MRCGLGLKGLDDYDIMLYRRIILSLMTLN
jgi:hypothetical protein